jgi:hypothetical protein
MASTGPQEIPAPEAEETTWKHTTGPPPKIVQGRPPRRPGTMQFLPPNPRLRNRVVRIPAPTAQYPDQATTSQKAIADAISSALAAPDVEFLEKSIVPPIEDVETMPAGVKPPIVRPDLMIQQLREGLIDVEALRRDAFIYEAMRASGREMLLKTILFDHQRDLEEEEEAAKRGDFGEAIRLEIARSIRFSGIDFPEINAALYN